MKTLISASVKGGVGKTTVAVGLAQALHRKGYQVGILDLDYRGPCVSIVLDVEDERLTRNAEDALIPVSQNGLHIFSMSFIWPPAKCVMVEDNDASADVAQLLTPGVIAWPLEMEYLVLDTPPTSSGIVKVALEASGATGAVIVSQPSRVSRADTIRTLDLFSEKQVPVYALVSNQGTNSQGQPLYDLNDADIEALAVQYHVPIFQAIPHTRELAPHFDLLVTRILTTQPVLLPKPKEPDDKIWQRVQTWASSLPKSS